MATLLTQFLGFPYRWSLDGYPLKRKSIPQLLGLISCQDPACNHYQTFDANGANIQCLFLPHHHTRPPLLRLPGEIRNSIYRILLTQHAPIDFARRLGYHLTLNKQIYAEARVILYTENEFMIMAHSWPVQGGILKKPNRFKKEDVELIGAWTFQTQVCSRPTELLWLCIKCLYHADHTLPGSPDDEPYQSDEHLARHAYARSRSIYPRSEQDFKGHHQRYAGTYTIPT